MIGETNLRLKEVVPTSFSEGRCSGHEHPGQGTDKQGALGGAEENFDK